MGTGGSSLLPVEKPDVLPVCGDARRKPVRSANALKSRYDVSVIQVGIIAAVAADELIVIGVAAFGTAFLEVDRLTSQDHRPPQRRLIMDLHGGLPGYCADVPPPCRASWSSFSSSLDRDVFRTVPPYL